MYKMQVLQEQPFKGIIYSIASVSGLMYIGSTTKPLEIRLRQHWYAFQRHNKYKTQRHMSSTQLFKEGRENVQVSVLEQGYFKSKKDLQKLEGQYIEKHLRSEHCVNKYLTGRQTKTRKEYNKEYAALQQTMFRECPKCKVIYRLGTWRIHTNRNKCKQNQDGQPRIYPSRIKRKLIKNQRSLYSCTHSGCGKEYQSSKALENHERQKHREQK